MPPSAASMPSERWKMRAIWPSVPPSRWMISIVSRFEPSALRAASHPAAALVAVSSTISPAASHCSERTDIFGQGGGARMAQDLGIPLLGEVPIEPRVRVGGDEGSPVVAADPSSAAARGFLDVAGKVAAQISIQNMRVLRVIQTA